MVSFITRPEIIYLHHSISQSYKYVYLHAIVSSMWLIILESGNFPAFGNPNKLVNLIIDR